MAHRVHKCKEAIEALEEVQNCKQKRNHIIDVAGKELVHCICDCVLNVLNGNIKLEPEEKQRLKRHKHCLRELVKKKTSEKKRKHLIQEGGFLRSPHPYTWWISWEIIWIIMDRMKKLLMMDSRTFNRLTTPKDKVLTSIEGQMTSILDDESLPEDVRAKLYASAQSRFMKIEHPQWGETTITNTKTLNSPDVVLDTLPNSLVRKAKRISDILKSTNRVWVNDKNEFVIDGDVVRGSNANDVYLDILKKRQNTSPDTTRLHKSCTKRASRKTFCQIFQLNVRGNPSVTSVYVTPGRPNTRSKKKKITKYETLYP